MNLYAVEYEHNGEQRRMLVKADSLWEVSQNMHPSIAGRAHLVYLMGDAA
jgi:hypothetical protein